MKWFRDSRFFLRTVVVAYALHLIEIQGTSGLPSITIAPKYTHINSSGTVIVTCNAGQSLVACQFRRSGRTIDLSLGPASSPEVGNKYFGTGLHNGDCGIEMSGFFSGFSQGIGCRVRSMHGGWVYDRATVQCADTPGLDFYSEPPGDAIVLPGKAFTIIHRLKNPTNYSLNQCRFKINSFLQFNNLTFDKGEKSDVSNKVAYFGAGLERGECGAQFYTASEELNGFGWAALRVTGRDKGFVQPSTVIIVVESPSNSVMAIEKTNYTEGETLTAKCTVSNSRPVANITWYLGDEIIRSDKDDESPISEIWWWSYYLQTIRQTISRKLTLGDHGKRLTCQTQHLAIQNGGVINESTIIAVKYKRGDNIKIVKETDVVVGHTVVLNVPTSSASKPDVFWLIGDNILKDGQSDSTGQFHASRSVNVDGEWITQLVITNVTLGDIEREYRLIAETSKNREEFKVILSTRLSNNGADGQLSLFIGIGLAAYAFLVTVCLVATCICWRKRRITPNEGRVEYHASADSIPLYDDVEQLKTGERLQNKAGKSNNNATVDDPEYFEIDDTLVRDKAGRRIPNATVAQSDLYDDIDLRR